MRHLERALSILCFCESLGSLTYSKWSQSVDLFLNSPKTHSTSHQLQKYCWNSDTFVDFARRGLPDDIGSGGGVRLGEKKLQKVEFSLQFYLAAIASFTWQQLQVGVTGIFQVTSCFQKLPMPLRLFCPPPTLCSARAFKMHIFFRFQVGDRHILLLKGSSKHNEKCQIGEGVDRLLFAPGRRRGWSGYGRG